MPTPDPSRTRAFASSEALHQWLRAHHAVEPELWVKVFKKGSGVRSVDWGQIVEETLCWGWIDGVKKSLDEHAFLQRITPRKARSAWSKRNTEHVERLIAEGRMQEPGLVHVRAAQADGRWAEAYAPASEMTVPADFLAALDADPTARRFYETLPKSSRYVIGYGLASAKKPETRQARFAKYLEMLRSGVKPDLGFSNAETKDPTTPRAQRGKAGGG